MRHNKQPSCRFVNRRNRWKSQRTLPAYWLNAKTTSALFRATQTLQKELARQGSVVEKINEPFLTHALSSFFCTGQNFPANVYCISCCGVPGAPYAYVLIVRCSSISLPCLVCQHVGCYTRLVHMRAKLFEMGFHWRPDFPGM